MAFACELCGDGHIGKWMTKTNTYNNWIKCLGTEVPRAPGPPESQTVNGPNYLLMSGSLGTPMFNLLHVRICLRRYSTTKETFLEITKTTK